MEVEEDNVFTLKLTAKELKLIQYWRESCHQYNNFCPLHCIPENKGTNFCHEVVKHLNALIKEQKGEK